MTQAQEQNQSPFRRHEDTGAYMRDVSDKETSDYHVTRILDENSPFIQRARHRGTQQSARRGLLHSSFAAGAAEASAIDAAQPLAIETARAHQQAAGQNLASLNQKVISDDQNATRLAAANISASAQLGAARIGADASITAARMRESGSMARLEAQLAAQSERDHLNHERTMQRDEAGFGRDMQCMEADFGFRRELAQDDQAFREMMTERGYDQDWRMFQEQSSRREQAEARNFFANLEGQYSQQYSSIMANPNMTPEQQQNAIQQINRNRASREAYWWDMFNDPPPFMGGGGGGG